MLSQTRPAANVPHPVLQQRRSVQLDAIPADSHLRVQNFQPPYCQQLNSQCGEQNQAATHLISMHQRAFIEHVVIHLQRLAARRVACSRCCDEVASRQVRDRQPLRTIGVRGLIRYISPRPAGGCARDIESHQASRVRTCTALTGSSQLHFLEQDALRSSNVCSSVALRDWKSKHTW